MVIHVHIWPVIAINCCFHNLILHAVITNGHVFHWSQIPWAVTHYIHDIVLIAPDNFSIILNDYTEYLCGTLIWWIAIANSVRGGLILAAMFQIHIFYTLVKSCTIISQPLEAVNPPDQKYPFLQVVVLSQWVWCVFAHWLWDKKWKR